MSHRRYHIIHKILAALDEEVIDDLYLVSHYFYSELTECLQVICIRIFWNVELLLVVFPVLHILYLDMILESLFLVADSSYGAISVNQIVSYYEFFLYR